MTSKINKPGDPQIIQQLASSDEEIVSGALEKLRDAGNTSYLPLLFGLFRPEVAPSIKGKVRSLLADVKKPEMVELLLEAIRNQKYEAGRAEIVSVCWENGLDFSAHLPFFVELVIENDLAVAFESYTVILNMEGKSDASLISGLIDKMESALPIASEGQAQLLRDIIDFLPELSSAN